VWAGARPYRPGPSPGVAPCPGSQLAREGGQPSPIRWTRSLSRVVAMDARRDWRRPACTEVWGGTAGATARTLALAAFPSGRVLVFPCRAGTD
jgi:hypothetical protein